MKGFFREVKRINWRLTFFGSKKRTAISLMVFIPALVGAFSFGYQYYLKMNPGFVYMQNLHKITDQVSKSVELPKDEPPTVATVTDKNVLPKEKFFSLAQNGDKILMYKKHKLAVLYRPSAGIVITKATLIFGDPTPTPKAAVAGASTTAAGSAEVSPTPGPTVPYHPQGKILVMPQQ